MIRGHVLSFVNNFLGDLVAQYKILMHYMALIKTDYYIESL